MQKKKKILEEKVKKLLHEKMQYVSVSGNQKERENNSGTMNNLQGKWKTLWGKKFEYGMREKTSY